MLLAPACTADGRSRADPDPPLAATPHGLVDAIGLLGQVVTGDFVGPGPATAAHPPILADAALPLQQRDIAQVLEERRTAPDLGELLLLHVARHDVEVAAGLHLPDVADEAEAGAGQAALGMAVHVAVTVPLAHPAGHGRVRVGMHLELLQVGAVGFRPLPHDAVVVGSVGGLEEDLGGLLAIVDPVQRALVVFRREFLRPQRLPPTRRHQQEGMEGHRSQILGQGQQVVEVVHVQLGDGGVDLYLHPGLDSRAHAAHRSFERSRHSAEVVVQLSRREVDGDGDAGDPHLLHPAGYLRGHQGAVGRHHRPQTAALDGMLDKIEDVGPHEGVAPREDHDRVRERGDIVQEGLALLQREFARIWAFFRGSPAVPAGQVARPGDLPGDELGQVLDRRLPDGGLLGCDVGGAFRDHDVERGGLRDRRGVAGAAVAAAHRPSGCRPPEMRDGMRSASQRAASLA